MRPIGKMEIPPQLDNLVFAPGVDREAAWRELIAKACECPPEDVTVMFDVVSGYPAVWATVTVRSPEPVAVDIRLTP